MRKIFFTLRALIVLVAAAAIIGPKFYNWNVYKPDVIAKVEAETNGRKAYIDGDISVSLFPSPVATVHGLRIASLPGATEPDLVTLSQVDVHLKFIPLLSGELAPSGITLIDPVAALEVLADGRKTWDFAVSPAPSATPGTGGQLQPPPPATPAPTAAAAGEDIGIHNLSIENGTVIWRDQATGSVDRVTNIDTDVTLDSMNGPFALDGSMVARGLETKIEGQLGDLRSLPAPLTATATIADTTVQFNGTFSNTPKGAAVNGKLQANSPDPSRLFLAGGGSVPGFLGQPLTLAATIAGDGVTHDMTIETLSLGDLKATGRGRVVVRDDRTLFDVGIVAPQVDLDRWMAMPAKTAPVPSESTTTAPISTPANPAAPAQPGARGATPQTNAKQPTTEGTIDLRIDSLVWNSRQAKNAHVLLAMAGPITTIKEATVSLPGNGTVALTGTLDSSHQPTAVSGVLEAKADETREVLQWAGVDVADVPTERLRKFDLHSEFTGNSQQMTINRLHATLDGATANGAATVQFGQRTGIGARVSVDRLNLDAYRSKAVKKTAGTPTPLTGTGDQAPAATDSASEAAGAWYDAVDANVVATAQAVTVGGQTAQGIDLNITLQNGKLTLNSGKINDIAGATVNVTRYSAAMANPLAFSLENFDLRVPDPARTFKALGRELPAGSKPGSIEATGHARGENNTVNLDTRINAFGGATTVMGVIREPKSADPKADIKFNADFPQAAPIFAIVAPGMLPQETLAQIRDLKGEGTVTGSYKALDVDLSFVGNGVGGFRAKGKLTDLGTDKAGIDMGMSARDFRMQLFAPILEDQVPDAALKFADTVNGSLTARGPLAGPQLEMDLTFSGFGGSTTTKGKVIGAAGGSPTIDLTLGANYPQSGPLFNAIAPGKLSPETQRNLGQLTMNGKVAGGRDNLRIDLALAGNGVGNFNANGTIAKPFDPDPNLDMAVKAQDFRMQLFAPLIGGDVPTAPFALAERVNGTVNAKGKASAPTLNVNLRAEGMGGFISAKGNIADATTSSPQIDLAVDANYPDAGAVLGAAAPGKLPPEVLSKLGPLALKGTIKDSGNKANLDLDMNGGAGNLKLIGSVTEPGSEKRSFDMTAVTQNFRVSLFAPLLGDALPPGVLSGIGNVSGRATLRGTQANPRVDMDMNAQAYGGAVASKGTVDLSGQEAALNIGVSAQSLNLQPLAPLFKGTNQETLMREIQTVSGTASVVGKSSALTISNIDLQSQAFGTSLAAKGNLSTVAPAYTTNLSLSFGELDVDRVMAAVSPGGAKTAPQSGTSGGGGGSGGGGSSAPGTQLTPLPQGRSLHPDWSREVFSFGDMSKINAQVAFAGNRLKYDKYAFDKVSGLVRLKDGVARVENFRSQTFANNGQPNITINATATLGQLMDVQAKYQLTNLDLSTIAETFSGQGRRIGGGLNVSGDLATRGRSVAELIVSLDGTAQLGGVVKVALRPDERALLNAAGGPGGILGNVTQGTGLDKILGGLGGGAGNVLGAANIATEAVSGILGFGAAKIAGATPAQTQALREIALRVGDKEGNISGNLKIDNGRIQTVDPKITWQRATMYPKGTYDLAAKSQAMSAEFYIPEQPQQLFIGVRQAGNNLEIYPANPQVPGQAPAQQPAGGQQPAQQQPATPVDKGIQTLQDLFKLKKK
ncbi:MAG: AsmA family protein [Alphaproteobacteria bacterium]